MLWYCRLESVKLARVSPFICSYEFPSSILFMESSLSGFAKERERNVAGVKFHERLSDSTLVLEFLRSRARERGNQRTFSKR